MPEIWISQGEDKSSLVYCNNIAGLIKSVSLKYDATEWRHFIDSSSRNFTAVGECPRGVIVKAMDYKIVVREFELQSPYCVYFRTNTLDKDMNPLILPAMG